MTHSPHTAFDRLVEVFDLELLIDGQTRCGRRHLPVAVVDLSRKLRELCVEVRQEWSGQTIPEDRQRSLELAWLVAHIPTAAQSDAAVDYAGYIDLPVFYWHLYGLAAPFPARAATLAELVHALAQDVGLREVFGADPAVNAKRLALVGEVLHFCRCVGPVLETSRSTAAFGALPETARPENSLQVAVRCTGFPQTKLPDERFFVRCLQMSELCFMGIRDAVIQALHAPERASHAGKAQALAEATRFADLLLAILRLLHTLTQEDFLRFRELTGNSSAVQSFNYQSMEFVLYGPSDTKARLLAHNAHYGSLLAATDPENKASLAEFLRQMETRASETGVAELLAWARKLDRRLLGWRMFHLRIAAAYIPEGKMGTGGTEGVPYLRHVLQKRLFTDTVAEDINLRVGREAEC